MSVVYCPECALREFGRVRDAPPPPQDRVPRFLLHRKIGLRALLPGALLASVVLGGTAAASPFFLAEPLNANGRVFGSFGVAITMIGYVFVMITLSLICAVFAPVWTNWRETEAQLARPSAGRDVLSPVE